MEGLEMDVLHHCGVFCASLAILWCVAAHADQHANLASTEDRYDLRRLMQPTAAELASEEKGRVHIYDSLEINEVNAALDENFERIQNMMFISINHPPPPGAGPDEEVEVEDDGC
jgi:hypothetical protein